MISEPWILLAQPGKLDQKVRLDHVSLNDVWASLRDNRTKPPNDTWLEAKALADHINFNSLGARRRYKGVWRGAPFVVP